MSDFPRTEDLLQQLRLTIEELSDRPVELFNRLAINIPPNLRGLIYSFFMTAYYAGCIADGVETGPIDPGKIVIKGYYTDSTGRATTLENILKSKDDFSDEYKALKIVSVEVVISPEK